MTYVSFSIKNLGPFWPLIFLLSSSKRLLTKLQLVIDLLELSSLDFNDSFHNELHTPIFDHR